MCSLFYFLFVDPDGSADNEGIKDNMAIIQENQDIHSNQIQKTFNFVNLTYAEKSTNKLCSGHYKRTSFK